MTQTSSTQSRTIFASNTFCILMITSNNLWWPNTCCATTCCYWTGYDTHTHTHTHFMFNNMRQCCWVETFGHAHTIPPASDISNTHTYTHLFVQFLTNLDNSGTNSSCVVRLPDTLALKDWPWKYQTDPVNISNWCARQCWACISRNNNILSLACSCKKINVSPITFPEYFWSGIEDAIAQWIRPHFANENH